MTTRNSSPYLNYLEKLVGECSNTYPRSIFKNLLMLIVVLSAEIEVRFKVTNFKVGYIVRITKYKNIFSKGYTKNWIRKIFMINSLSKTNPWAYKIKDSNR